MGMGIRNVPVLPSNFSRSFFLPAAALVFSPIFFGSVHDVSALSCAAILLLSVFFSPAGLFDSLTKLPRFFTWAAGAVILWMAAQSWFLPASDAARIESFKMLAYGLIFCLSLSQPLQSLRTTSSILIAAGVLTALYGGAQVLSGSEHVLWRAKETHLGYWTGTFMNRNHFAGYLELILGLTAVQMISCRREEIVKRALSAGIFIFLTGSIFMSGSRFGFLCVLLAMLGYGASQRVFFKKTGWGIAGAVIFAGIYIFQKQSFGRYFDFEEPFSLLQSERWQVWNDSLILLRENLWTGLGAGSFGYFFPSVQSEKLIFGWPHAHNGYLEMLLEWGLPVFLLFTAGWGFWTVQIIKKFRELPASGKAPAAALAFGLGAFLLHGFSDFNFSIPSNMLLFSFCAAYFMKLLEKTP